MIMSGFINAILLKNKILYNRGMDLALRENTFLNSF